MASMTPRRRSQWAVLKLGNGWVDIWRRMAAGMVHEIDDDGWLHEYYGCARAF